MCIRDRAQIYPDIQKIKEVFITYYVTSEHVSLLKEKQGVRLSLEKVGNQTLTINGTIQSIDKSATKTDQGNLFKVTALSKLSNKNSDVVQYLSLIHIFDAYHLFLKPAPVLACSNHAHIKRQSFHKS